MSVSRVVISVLALGAVVALLTVAVKRVTGRRLHIWQQALAGLLIVLAVGIVFMLERPSDTERVEEALEVIAAGSPSVCGDRMTDAYLTQATGRRPPFDVPACEASIGRSGVERLKVDQISIDGDTASAVVTNSGGGLDGSRVRLRLCKEGGYWKLDRLLGFPHFDRPGYEHAYRHSVLAEGTSGGALNCVSTRIRPLPDARIESLLLRGEAPRRFARIAVECDRPGVERGISASVATPDFGLSRTSIECVAHRVGGLPAAELADVVMDQVSLGKLIVACEPAAFLNSTNRYLLSLGVDEQASACVLRRMEGLSTSAAVRLSYDRGALEEAAASCPEA